MQKQVTGLRLDERLERKVARAVELSGWPKADVLRLALSRGLDDLEAIDYDIDGAIARAVRALKSQAPPMMKASMAEPKRSHSTSVSGAAVAPRKGEEEKGEEEKGGGEGGGRDDLKD